MSADDDSNGRQSGFTLIEMLVAMAIFATLISVLILGFQQGLMMWEKGGKQSQRWLNYEFRYRLMDSLFSQAVISNDRCKEFVYTPYFSGDEHRMQFVSAAPVMDTPGRIRPVMLRAFREPSGRWSLRYREGARFGDMGRGISWGVHWVNILTDLKELSFSFEAPVYQAPMEMQVALLPPEVKRKYRDKPAWMKSYDACRLDRYPKRVHIHFADDQEELHDWFFASPQWPEAWTMEVISLE